MAQDVKYVVYEGGGLKGIEHFAVIEFLMKVGLWEDVAATAGSSAGALAAVISATGWTYEQMYARYTQLDLEKMIKGESIFSRIPYIGSYLAKISNLTFIPYNIYQYKGLHKADLLEQEIEKIVKEVTGIDQCTFEQWHDLKTNNQAFSHLKDIFMEAGCVETGFNEIFSHKSEENKKVPISRAAKASSAFPGYIAPVLINGKHYIDGGAQRNCPGEIFEKVPGVPHKKVVCVMLEEKEDIEYYLQGKPPKPKPVTSLWDFFLKVLNLTTKVQSYDMLTSAYKAFSIFCDTKGISTFDFNGLKGKEPDLLDAALDGCIAHFTKRIPGLVEKFYSEDRIQLALSRAIVPPDAPQVMRDCRTKNRAVTHAFALSKTTTTNTVTQPEVTNLNRQTLTV